MRACVCVLVHAYVWVGCVCTLACMRAMWCMHMQYVWCVCGACMGTCTCMQVCLGKMANSWTERNDIFGDLEMILE